MLVKTKHTNWKLAAFGLGFALLMGGCASNKADQTAWHQQPEPKAEAVAVYADAGLGASDALGHQLFIENTDYRFASTALIYEMAAADEPNLNLERLPTNYEYKPAMPRQVIVSGEGVIDEPLAEPTTITAVETNYFE